MVADTEKNQQHFDAKGGIVMIPFVGMSADEAKPIANSWSEFVKKIEQ